MMRDLWNVLPDDRPITDICVVEEASKCPPGYQVVSRTYDQDTDADLWKDGFFGRKITRYLCISKTEGQSQYVIEFIAIINERDPPPEGFTLLSHTSDTDQRAMRKKQFCYKLTPRDKASQAVTDIIVLSKSKKAPQGFTSAGEMNSLLICFKAGPVPKMIPNSHTMTRSLTGTLPYSSSPISAPPVGPPPPAPPSLPYPVNPYASPQVSSLYPVNQLRQAGSVSLGTPGQGTTSQMLGGMTWPGPGGRQTPQPPSVTSTPYAQSPTSPSKSNSSTLSSSSLVNYGLDGIPFELNSRYKDVQTLQEFILPNINIKGSEEIEAQFNYDFRVEYQALQRIPHELQ